MDLLQEEGIKLFRNSFGDQESFCFSFAPGRVNLIGEHTDYNNGYVFPMALRDLGTLVVGRKTETDHISLATSASVEPKTFTYVKGGDIPQWARYVIGVVKKFEELTGLSVSIDAAIVSNLPMGAGLSSSASLEVSFFSFLEETYNKFCPKLDKIKACQSAEHEYAGVPCGIMDQFIATLGEEEKALFINCQTNEYSIVPFGGSDLVLVVTDTHQKHELAGGEYAKRRATCEAVSKDLGIPSLAEATLECLVAHFSIPNRSLDHLPPKAYARARHVVTEIARAVEGKGALEKGEMKAFGRLMNNSHKSLCDDYEVTCRELDEVVAVAWKTAGVLGSRMTGGGFGGCAITLVKASHVTSLMDGLKVHCPYASSFITTAGGGAQSWRM